MNIAHWINKRPYIFPIIFLAGWVNTSYGFYQYITSKNKMYQVSKEKLKIDDEKKRITYLQQLKRIQPNDGRIKIKPTSHVTSLRGFLDMTPNGINIQIKNLPIPHAPIVVTLYDKQINNQQLPTKTGVIGRVQNKNTNIQINKDKIQGKYIILQTYYGQAQGGAFIPLSNKN